MGNHSTSSNKNHPGKEERGVPPPISGVAEPVTSAVLLVMVEMYLLDCQRQGRKLMSV